MLGNGVSKQSNARKCLETAFPNKATRGNAWKRRFQTKQREEMLGNGISKQSNARKCLETAFPSKATRGNAWKRRFQTKQREEMLGNGFPSKATRGNAWKRRFQMKQLRCRVLKPENSVSGLIISIFPLIWKYCGGEKVSKRKDNEQV